MINVLSVENMRKSDAAAIVSGTPSRELMYRAGIAVCDTVEWEEPVAIVCGYGNNAGDGYVIAAELEKRAIDCTLFLLEERFSDDGKYYFDICRENGIEYRICDENTDLTAYRTVVDCIFGTGFRGDVKGKAKSVIEAINACRAKIISVDINSGLNGNTGIGNTVVHSDLTVSIGGYKSGHFLNMAKDFIGSLSNCDIGIDPIESPYRLFESTDASAYIPPRTNFSNKSTYGYIALIGGSKQYSGAIRLSALANAAMRSGAGVAMIAAPQSLSHLLLPNILEATVYPLSEVDGEIEFNEDEIAKLAMRVKSMAFGMGIGLSMGSAKTLEYLLKNYNGTMIIDADALTTLSHADKGLLKNASCRVILTPHNMEFSRLSGLSVNEILEDPIEHAKRYAAENGCTLLLKGPTTVVTDGQTVYLIDRGCPGMATAGSGDVLSGILAAIGAVISDPLNAAATAAYINGRAGEIAQSRENAVSMIASDTVNAISAAISELIDL